MSESLREERYTFADPTFLDMAMRVRSHYRQAYADGKNRILWLLANAVAERFRTPRRKALGLLEWVCAACPHSFGGDERGHIEFYRRHALDILKQGWARCEPTAEVYAAMAWMAGFPSRIISIQRDLPQEQVYGHHVTEVFVEGKWAFMDPDTLRWYELPDGALASALDLGRDHDLVIEAERRRARRRWPPHLRFLKNFPYLDERGEPQYHLMLETIYVQEGIFSLDGFYGRWIRCRPDTEGYLYGPPQHPDAQALLREGLPWSYVRRSTHIEDHFHHAWEPPWD